MLPNPLQPLIEAVIHWALWFIPVLLAIAALKGLFSARLKGAAGERAVARVLNRLGEAALHDIILPDGRGGLTQIDHVVLTQAGLLVVETKNYAGQVLGQTHEFVNLFWPHFDNLNWPHPLLFMEALSEERAGRGGSLVSPPAVRLMDGDAGPLEGGWTACRFR